MSDSMDDESAYECVVMETNACPECKNDKFRTDKNCYTYCLNCGIVVEDTVFDIGFVFKYQIDFDVWHHHATGKASMVYDLGSVMTVSNSKWHPERGGWY